MNTHRKVVGLLAGAVLLGFVEAVPAQAEGSRDTYFTGWHQGAESQRWADGNRDNVSTSVTLSRCNTDGGTDFEWARLKLWKHRTALPDQDKGSRDNYCGKSAWGDPGSGTFYFELNGFGSGGTMSAKKVVIRY